MLQHQIGWTLVLVLASFWLPRLSYLTPSNRKRPRLAQWGGHSSVRGEWVC